VTTTTTAKKVKSADAHIASSKKILKKCATTTAATAAAAAAAIQCQLCRQKTSWRLVRFTQDHDGKTGIYCVNCLREDNFSDVGGTDYTTDNFIDKKFGECEGCSKKTLHSNLETLTSLESCYDYEPSEYADSDNCQNLGQWCNKCRYLAGTPVYRDNDKDGCQEPIFNAYHDETRVGIDGNCIHCSCSFDVPCTKECDKMISKTLDPEVDTCPVCKCHECGAKLREKLCKICIK
jgi:hypothetical protein